MINRFRPRTPGQRAAAYALAGTSALTAANRAVSRLFGSPVTTSDLVTVGKGAYNAVKSMYPKRARGKARRYIASKTIAPYKKKATLKKRVNNLSRAIKATEGTLIYRKRTTERLLTAVNEKGYGTVSGQVDMASYETVLGELRFFNPSAPATLIQGSGASGTYFRDYLFTNVSSYVKLTNNYQVPCKVTVMAMCPKADTSINPATAFQNGLTDTSAASSQSQLTYFTDSDEFNKLWKTCKSKVMILAPGRTLNINYGVKNVRYDPAVYDSHALQYQKRFKCFVWLVKVEGVLGHDTSADQQGMLQAGVDIVANYTYTVKYDAGADIKFIVVSDGSDTFTNGGIVSSKPVSDNIGYSVA